MAVATHRAAGTLRVLTTCLSTQCIGLARPGSPCPDPREPVPTEQVGSGPAVAPLVPPSSPEKPGPWSVW